MISFLGEDFLVFLSALGGGSGVSSAAGPVVAFAGTTTAERSFAVAECVSGRIGSAASATSTAATTTVAPLTLSNTAEV